MANKKLASVNPLAKLDAFDSDSGEWNVVIDTPKGSRNKFKYDDERGLFKLRKVLPSGAIFPYDFGFVPRTRGDDGDPLDVLVLMDEPAFVGCLVAARLVGVIEAEQTEEGETTRNDRLIAVAAESRNHGDVRALEDLNSNLVDEIEHFFVSYNEMAGKVFSPLGRSGPDRAEQLIRQAEERPRKRTAGRGKPKAGRKKKAKKA